MVNSGPVAASVAAVDQLMEHAEVFVPQLELSLERERGFEPPTFCLGSRHSATELLPPAQSVRCTHIVVNLPIKKVAAF